MSRDVEVGAQRLFDVDMDSLSEAEDSPPEGTVFLPTPWPAGLAA